jgi:2',3'-cyclic-nucleotide 2'-phosphodiesterase (5'-nucleotidase family)
MVALMLPISAVANADTTYVVQKGDTLQKIAKKYGDESKYLEIQKANPQVTKPNSIQPGWKLVIPFSKSPHSSTQITFLYFNDFHGALEPIKEKEKEGDQEVEKYGIARMATEVKRIQAENKVANIPTFFVTSGDLLQGTVLSNFSKGQIEADYLNKLGLSYYTIGNHELDFGPDPLSSLLVHLKAQCVTANYYIGTMCKPVPVILNNLKMGIAGLVAKEDFLGKNAKVAREYLKDVQIEDEVTSAKQLVADFKSQGITLIVLLSHLGIDRDKTLASEVSGIDVIIGGDSHTAIEGYQKSGNTCIVQAGEKGKYLGRLDLELDNHGRPTSVNAKLLKLDQQITPDPEIAADLQAKKKELEEGEFGKRIADSECKLDGERGHVRGRETNLGNLLCDVLKETYQTDIAVFNGGGIRDSIVQGPVTTGAIFKAFPFTNTVQVLEISGQTLLEMLQHSFAQRGQGGFLQVAGLRFVLEKNVGVKDVIVNDKPLDLKDTYKVVTSSFVADGGDGYTMLANLSNRQEHGYSLVSETILKHLINHYGKEKKAISSPYCENNVEPGKATRIIIEE